MKAHMGFGYLITGRLSSAMNVAVFITPSTILSTPTTRKTNACHKKD